jgi:hypothetical protein
MNRNYKEKLKAKKYHSCECFDIKILNFKLNDKQQHTMNEKQRIKKYFLNEGANLNIDYIDAT